MKRSYRRFRIGAVTLAVVMGLAVSPGAAAQSVPPPPPPGIPYYPDSYQVPVPDDGTGNPPPGMVEDESEAAQFLADGTVIGPNGQVIPEDSVSGGGQETPAPT